MGVCETKRKGFERTDKYPVRLSALVFISKVRISKIK